MYCSGLSILQNVSFAIGALLFNGAIYQDKQNHLSAIRVENPLTHASYIFANEPYKKCFEHTNPIVIASRNTPWIPDEPLTLWDKGELIEELTDCKNSYRVLKYDYLAHKMKAIPKATPKAVQKITPKKAVRAITIVSETSTLNRPAKFIAGKEIHKTADLNLANVITLPHSRPVKKSIPKLRHKRSKGKGHKGKRKGKGKKKSYKRILRRNIIRR